MHLYSNVCAYGFHITFYYACLFKDLRHLHKEMGHRASFTMHPHECELRTAHLLNLNGKTSASHFPFNVPFRSWLPHPYRQCENCIHLLGKGSLSVSHPTSYDWLSSLAAIADGSSFAEAALLSLWLKTPGPLSKPLASSILLNAMVSFQSSHLICQQHLMVDWWPILSWLLFLRLPC